MSEGLFRFAEETVENGGRARKTPFGHSHSRTCGRKNSASHSLSLATTTFFLESRENVPVFSTQESHQHVPTKRTCILFRMLDSKTKGGRGGKRRRSEFLISTCLAACLVSQERKGGRRHGVADGGQFKLSLPPWETHQLLK